MLIRLFKSKYLWGKFIKPRNIEIVHKLTVIVTSSSCKIKAL